MIHRVTCGQCGSVSNMMTNLYGKVIENKKILPALFVVILLEAYLQT